MMFSLCIYEYVEWFPTLYGILLIFMNLGYQQLALSFLINLSPVRLRTERRHMHSYSVY